MNIFKILSSYDGTLNEPNISAVLAYFFNPYEDHGIGYFLINKLVSLFGNNKNDLLNNYLKSYPNYQIKVIPEFPVDISHLNSKKYRRDIDILLEFYKSINDSVPDFSICVENKILESSFSDLNQLNEEILGLIKNYENLQNKKTELFLLLICPSENDKVKESFKKIGNNAKCISLTWKNGNISMVSIFNEILTAESNCSIDPLSTEVKYLIKSFISYINNNFSNQVVLEELNIEKRNYGKPIVDYLKEIYNELEDNKEYEVSEIKKKLSDNVKKQSGVILHNTTRNCQLYKVIVNDPNRTNYNVNQPLDERLNLFYYTDVNKRDKIKKFHLDVTDDIDIFWTQDGYRVSEKLSALKNKKNSV